MDRDYIILDRFHGRMFTDEMRRAIKWETGGVSCHGYYEGPDKGPVPDTRTVVILTDTENVIREVRAHKDYDPPPSPNTPKKKSDGAPIWVFIVVGVAILLSLLAL